MHTHIRICICMYTHTHTHTHTYIYIYTHTHIYIYRVNRIEKGARSHLRDDEALIAHSECKFHREERIAGGAVHDLTRDLRWD